MYLDKEKKLLYVFYDDVFSDNGGNQKFVIYTLPWRKTPAVEEYYGRKFALYLPPPSVMTTAIIDVSLCNINSLELRIKKSKYRLLPSLKRIEINV